MCSDVLPLNILLHVQNCTQWKAQILAIIPCQLETIYRISHDCKSTWSPPPPPLQTGKQGVSDVSIFSRAEGDFKLSAAKMFSFVPILTREENAWPSSTCLLYAPNHPVSTGHARQTEKSPRNIIYKLLTQQIWTVSPIVSGYMIHRCVNKSALWRLITIGGRR